MGDSVRSWHDRDRQEVSAMLAIVMISAAVIVVIVAAVIAYKIVDALSREEPHDGEK
jgi:heme/copper-type cytochrome/quinol oxidase subunit 2